MWEVRNGSFAQNASSLAILALKSLASYYLLCTTTAAYRAGLLKAEISCQGCPLQYCTVLKQAPNCFGPLLAACFLPATPDLAAIRFGMNNDPMQAASKQNS